MSTAVRDDAHNAELDHWVARARAAEARITELEADEDCSCGAALEQAEARLAAVLDLADRVTAEARDFEPINHDGEVAMSTRIHMMGLVRAVITDKLGGTE